MAGINEKREFGRIEDFIALAKEGKDVHAEIQLKRLPVTQKVHPGATADMSSEVDMYLLIGDFSFKVGGEVKHVCKVYLHGSLEEPADVLKVDSSIANSRLKMDYQRLKDAKIIFEEKYF